MTTRRQERGALLERPSPQTQGFYAPLLVLVWVCVLLVPLLEPLSAPMFGQLWPEGVALSPAESLGVVVALAAAVATGGSVGVCAKLTEPVAISAPTKRATAMAALKAQMRTFVISFLLLDERFDMTSVGGAR